MERAFDHSQKILLAVEFGTAPRMLPGKLPGYAIFQRLGITEVVRAFDEKESLFVRLLAGRKFQSVLNQHMGYWENRVPPGQQCYVHYAIGRDEVITEASEQLKGAQGWVLKGVYHTEPQSSAYPASFPVSPAPYHWSPDETLAFTEDSVFWFNFFPAQPALFAKTFAIWVLFQMYAHRERVECNQLCAWEGKERLEVRDVDPFVQVNLNRFTSLPGYFNSLTRPAGTPSPSIPGTSGTACCCGSCPELELVRGIATLARTAKLSQEFAQPGHALSDDSRVKFSPMTSSTSPVSAAAEQQHQNNDNEDQFHRKSPLKAMTSERHDF